MQTARARRRGHDAAGTTGASSDVVPGDASRVDTRRRGLGARRSVGGNRRDGARSMDRLADQRGGAILRITVRSLGAKARPHRRSLHPAHRAKAVAMAGPLGLVAGMFGSVVGVGGGVLIVPAITSAVPIPQRVVTGTSLIAVLSTAGVATYNFSHAGLVDPTAAAILGGSAMLSAPFGARLTTRLDCVQLRRILAYFLLCAAPLVPLKAAVFHYRGDGTDDGDGDEGGGANGDGHWTDGGGGGRGAAGGEGHAASPPAGVVQKFDAVEEAPSSPPSA